MRILVEGLGMCAILYIMCAIGIRKGAVGLVCLYEKDVQRKSIELGLTDAKKIQRTALRMDLCSVILYIGYLLTVVYVVNGTRGFRECFWQMTLILLIMGVFDRIVVDIFQVKNRNFIRRIRELCCLITIKTGADKTIKRGK